jgi:hypothetical protein
MARWRHRYLETEADASFQVFQNNTGTPDLSDSSLPRFGLARWGQTGINAAEAYGGSSGDQSGPGSTIEPVRVSLGGLAAKESSSG